MSLSSRFYGTVSVTSVLVGVRAESTEVDPVLHTEDPPGLLVGHTRILLRAQVLHEAGLSGDGHQILQNNAGSEFLLLAWFPTRRALDREQAVFPGKVEAGSTEAVATAYGDWVCKVTPTDTADELFVEGL